MAMRLTKRTYFRPNRAYYERPNFTLAADSILLPGDKAFLPGWVHSIGPGDAPYLRAPRKELEF
jgi:hypothetical protein